MKSLSTVAKSLMTTVYITGMLLNCTSRARGPVHGIRPQGERRRSVDVPLDVVDEAEHPVKRQEGAVIGSSWRGCSGAGVTFIGGPSCSM
jgi:hypothetical protein